MNEKKRGAAYLQPIRGTCRGCGLIAKYSVFRRGKWKGEDAKCLGDFCRECGEKRVKLINWRMTKDATDSVSGDLAVSDSAEV